MNMSVCAWDGVVTEKRLEKWLNNFDGSALGSADAEQVLAAWLLMNFTFYREDEIKELCKVVHRQYISMQLDGCFVKTNKRREFIDRIISRTLFLPLGNPSESGAHLLYYYRTANNLPKNLFDDQDIEKSIQNKSIDNIVLFDDIMITGEQVKNYTKRFKKLNCKKTLSLFFATQDAADRMASINDDISINCANVLDNRSRLFSRESFAFSNDSSRELKPLVEKMCMYYGNKLVKEENNRDLEYMSKYPLGFGDSQLTLGFNYNVPDNTLPIFWWETTSWYPILKRNTKKTTIENREVIDEQYW